jgi:hypothetical protein
MILRRHILLGYLAAYLILCLGAATGVTLPGRHTLTGFKPSLAFFAFGGSIEAVQDCPAKKVMIVAHDTTGSFRATAHGTLVFMQAGEGFTTPWTLDKQNPSNDQVIATVSTQATSGTWTVHLEEDPSVATSFQVPSGPCPPSTPRPTPTPAPAPPRTPTPTPTCPPQFVYDTRAGRCVAIGSTGLG